MGHELILAAAATAGLIGIKQTGVHAIRATLKKSVIVIPANAGIRPFSVRYEELDHQPSAAVKRLRLGQLRC